MVDYETRDYVGMGHYIDVGFGLTWGIELGACLE